MPPIGRVYHTKKHSLTSTIDHSDVSVTSLTTNDILTFDGTDWVNTATPIFDSATIGSIVIPTLFTDARDPTGFTNRTDSTLSWDDATYTLTITGTHYIYINGVKSTKETDSIQITDSTGIHWIYYDNDGVLQESLDTDGPGFQYNLIATVYWNTSMTAPGKGLVGDERHGHKMDFITHGYLHNSVGTRYVSGLTGTFGDITFDTTLGVIYDEDIAHNIGAETTANVLYKDGSADYKWLENQTKYYYEDGGSDINYNNGNTLTPVPANQYVAYWIFATNDATSPIVSLMGQRIDTTIANARINNKYESLELGTLPFKEMKLLYRVILRNDATPYEETQDLRSVSNLPAGTYVATSHSVLTDLLVDDHSQYALLAGRSGGQELFGSTVTAEDLTLTDNSVDNNSITVTQAIAAYTHIGESGASHTYIDQSVVSGATPTFTATNITGVPAASILAGTFGTGAYVFDNTVSGITTLTATSLTDGTATLTGGVLSVISQIGTSGDANLLQLTSGNLAVNGNINPTGDISLDAGKGLTDVSGNVLFEYEDTGDIVLRAPSSANQRFNIESNGNTEFGIDTNNDSTTRSFNWTHNGTKGAGTTLMQLTEAGTLTIWGDVTIQSSATTSVFAPWRTTFDAGESGAYTADRYLDYNNGAQMEADDGYNMHRAGSITGVSVSLEVTAQTTAGLVFIEVRNNGSVALVGIVTIDGTGHYYATATQARGTDAFAVDDVLTLYVSFPSFAGTLQDTCAFAEVVFDT